MLRQAQHDKGWSTAQSDSGLKIARLSPDSLPIGTVALARALIGLVLVRASPQGRTAGKIVEVEAYLSERDPASHAHRGRTNRNASMFLAPFHAYVYKIYGTSFCVNVSSEAEGLGQAVLLRALEPLDGLPLMMQRSGTNEVRNLCRGPGRLCRAMAIDQTLDGAALIRGSELWLGEAGLGGKRIRKSKRIGITKAADRHLRFYEADSIYLSGPRYLSP